MNRASKQEATTTMGVLADWQVEAEKIIEPFTNSQKVEGIITHGVSSYGYDLRASQEFEVFTAANETGGYIDPKNFNPKFLEKVQGNVIIPPNAFALTRSIEKLSVPRDVLAIVLGKSTYARCGLVVNCTPLEPEWRGHVTLELSNTTPKPAIVYAGEGIAQVLFLRADGLTQVLLSHVLDRMTEEAFRDGRAEPREYAEKQLQKLLTASLCKTSYADKGGRYQDQKDGVVMPCVRGQTPLHPSGEVGTGVTAATWDHSDTFNKDQ